MNRSFEVKIVIEADTETVQEGIDRVTKTMDQLSMQVREIKLMRRTRTDLQNAALHLYFTQLSDELNEAGYDMRKTIRAGINIPWTPESIKENLWRPVQLARTGKRSTTALDTSELDTVYEIVNKTIGERTGVHVPFPSKEGLANQLNPSL